MIIQFNTDESVEGNAALGAHAESVARKALGRFSDHLSRVEIHLSDVNGDRETSADKRCLMEARISGRRPISVREHADTLHQALDGAAVKMVRRLDSTLGKLSSRKRGPAAIKAKRTAGNDVEEQTAE